MFTLSLKLTISIRVKTIQYTKYILNNVCNSQRNYFIYSCLCTLTAHAKNIGIGICNGKNSIYKSLTRDTVIIIQYGKVLYKTKLMCGEANGLV